ncbi:MAG: PfkB family carbohydrate kinase [Elusimicrobiota bacterium]
MEDQVYSQPVIIGSVGLDDIETPFGKRTKVLGGSAVYACWACSYFNPVSLVGVRGEDFPEDYVKEMNDRDIDLDSLIQKPGNTFHWKGKYGYDLNTARTLATDLNVLEDYYPEISPEQKEARYVFLANIDPEMQLKALEQFTNPELVAVDTMNFWIENTPEKLKKVLEYTDYLFINDAEARQLGEDPNLVTAVNNIFKMGPAVIVVKQGEYGVTVFYSASGKEKIEVFTAPSMPLDTVLDPTGAGDSFGGAFMGYLASKDKINETILKQAVVLGSVMASFTVEGFSVEKLKEVVPEKIYDRFKYLKKISHIENLKEETNANR